MPSSAASGGAASAPSRSAGAPRRTVRNVHSRYLGWLSLIFIAWWIVLAISPLDRRDWALENVLVGFAVLFIAATRRSIPFSRVSYTCIFLFLSMHVLGAHYTFALTPYDDWFQALSGFSLNEAMGTERNHYDRVVHFAFGLLLAYPVRELFIRAARVRGFWGYFFPLNVIMAASMFYEVLEWGAALVFGGDLGIAFLGTQGDEWDAQKDMALATLGALIAMAVTAAVNVRLQRDFAREWNASLKVSRRTLGEDEILRMMKARERSD